MQYKFSVWQVITDDVFATFETRELALRKAAEINEYGKRLAYVKEIKVYGGERDEHTKHQTIIN